MISKEEHDQLRKQYSPDGSLLRKGQMRMLDMLTFLDKVCRENNLTYWLEGGTLLGAVRHGGFIPWDDDTDIMMPTKDLKKLKKIIAQDKYKSEPYRLQTAESDSGFFEYWCVLRDLRSEYVMDRRIHNRRKYRGLQVDIFPVDTALNQKLRNFSNWYSTRVLGRLVKYPIPNWMIFLPDFFLRNILNPIFRSIRCKSSESVFTYDYGCCFYEIHKTENVFPLKEIAFEGRIFKCPNNCDAYLQEIYGSTWGELPPEGKRRQDAHSTGFKIEDQG